MLKQTRKTIKDVFSGNGIQTSSLECIGRLIQELYHPDMDAMGGGQLNEVFINEFSRT